MPAFNDPLWLSLLVVIPFVRWLHRWHASVRRHLVPALFLWERGPDTQGTGTRRREPDPAWRRRASAVALLVLAMSQPEWQATSGRITVWVDDSLSMLTREGGQSRLEAALLEVRRAQADRRVDEVVVRSLGDPGYLRRYGRPGELDVRHWLGREPHEAVPPPGALMSRDSAHWLLTDGASPLIRQWAERAPLGRIINVGRATENTAIILVGARRSADSAAALDVVVSVVNTGSASRQSVLRLEADGRGVGEVPLSVGAGQRIISHFTLPGLPRTLTARFGDGDDLTEDDALSVDLAALQPLPVGIGAGCPENVGAVIDAHPGLRRAWSPAESRVDFHCNVTATEPVPQPARPRVRFLAGAAMPVDEPPAWNIEGADMPGFALQADWIAATGWRDRSPDGRTLLLTSVQPLVTASRHGSRFTTIDTVVDLQAEAFVRQPEYALFVSELISRALERPLLDVIGFASRAADNSVIAPVAMAPARAGTDVSAQVPLVDLSRWLFVLALLVILWDSAVFLRDRSWASNG